MTTNDLANINSITRKLIRDYITRNGITEAKFARDAGIHQNQLWLYLNSNNEKKGLHTTTLEKIGKFLSNE
jgi:transcriptional regulator with XRE-family HTH domain